MALLHSNTCSPTTFSFAENNDPTHHLCFTTTTLTVDYTNEPSPCSADLLDTDLPSRSPPQHSRHPQSHIDHGKMSLITTAVVDNDSLSRPCDGPTTTSTCTTTPSTPPESTFFPTWEPSPVVDTLPCRRTSQSSAVTARNEFTTGKEDPFLPPQNPISC